MIKRFFTLILFIGIGLVAFQNIDISTSWQKAQAFVEDNLGEGILEEIKEGRLEGKKDVLEKKLEDLVKTLTAKAEEGTDKYKEIEFTVLETKRALEATKQALQDLQSSAERSASVLGITDENDSTSDGGTSSTSSTSSGTTHNYYQTITQTVPSAEIEAFCEQWSE